MKTLGRALVLASAVFAVQAMAQTADQSVWDRIVLEDKAGNVMTSTGGDYQTAVIGKELIVGEHMMLSGDKTLAKVVYYELDDDGDVIRKCVKDYSQPDTYIIDASCIAAVAWTNGSVGAGAGIIAGAAVIGGVLIDIDDDVPVGPLSTAVRHF